MANEVQKEPTMEEILASIRKIISDDGNDVTDPTESPLRAKSDDMFVDTPGNDDFEDLTYDDAPAPAAVDVFTAHKETALVFEDDTGAALVAEFNDNDETPLSSIEDLLGDPEIEMGDEDLPSFAIPADGPVAETAPAPEPRFTQEPAFTAPESFQPQVPQEDSMAASNAAHNSALTDDRTADAAAGALGKLMASMDVSSDNSLEGLVRSMLQPMLKEWLDANLSGIVESKVEAEVQRIARMAR